MKICRALFIAVFAVLLSSSVSAQVINTFDLTIFKPLPEVDLGALSIANDLSGAPRVFQVTIAPEGVDVFLEGEIAWTDVGQTQPKTIFNFKTRIFKSKTFYNTDLGSNDIRISSSHSNNNVINELVKKGKPSGRFDINLTLKNPAGMVLRSATDFIEFLNPSQSFTVLTPAKETNLQLGNFVASWIQVPGATKYRIRVNERKNSSQSLEDALRSGNPIIDYREIPNTVASINLAQLPNLRPILEGQELVLQVVAIIQLPTGNSELESDIVNFFVSGSNDARNNAIKNDLISITQSLPGNLGSTLVNLLSDPNFRIKRLVDEKGNPISDDQLKNLLNYLNANPDQIVNAIFVHK